MKAILQDEPGDVNTMYVGEIAIPEPQEHEICIQVYCTALNQMDLLQRKGMYPVPDGASKILGVEVSGVISKIGPNCSDKFKVGDKCLALIQGGGYAEYAISHECTVMLAPDNVSMTALAAIPEQWVTAYQLLFKVANMVQGESVLIHAGSSGVGQAAIQIATMNGIKCYATCRGDEKVQCCLDMGAVAAFNIKEHAHDFSNMIKSANANQGVNVVLDCVGSNYASQNIETLSMDGRWVVYATMGGKSIHDDMFLGRLMAKRISILPSTLRSRSVAYKRDLIESIERDILSNISNNQYKILIDSVYPLTTEGVREAHTKMGSFQNIGKIVLNVCNEQVV